MQADIDRARFGRRVYSAMLVCVLAAGLGLTLLDEAGAGPTLCLLGLLLGGLLAANLWLDAPVRPLAPPPPPSPSPSPSPLTEI